MSRRSVREMPWTGSMTRLPDFPTPERRTVRELLVRQQHAAQSELPLPRFLRTPSIVILWTLTLATVVVAFAAGRVQVPRHARGVVVVEGSTPDRLTTHLLLPASASVYVRPGQLAAVDTGGTSPFVVAIAASARDISVGRQPKRSALGLAAITRGDTAMVAIPVEPCRGGHCLPRSANRRFSATATLGTRSLASFALPRS